MWQTAFQPATSMWQPIQLFAAAIQVAVACFCAWLQQRKQACIYMAMCVHL